MASTPVQTTTLGGRALRNDARLDQSLISLVPKKTAVPNAKIQAGPTHRRVNRALLPFGTLLRLRASGKLMVRFPLRKQAT